MPELKTVTKKRVSLASYFLSLFFGLISLLSTTIALTFGLIPLLAVKTMDLQTWSWIGVTAVSGIIAFESLLWFRVYSDVIVTERKDQFLKKTIE